MFTSFLTSLALAFALVIPTPTAGISTRIVGAVLPITHLGRNICTATKINSRQDLWLTANHCVPPDGNPEIVMIGGVRAVPFDRSEEKDLAVLFVPGLKAQTLKLARYRPVVGDKVKMWGHPIGSLTPQLFQGFISSLILPFENRDEETGELESTEYHMMFDMAVCGGNSGSVVLNQNEEVISVLQIGVGQRPCMPWSGGSTWSDLVRFAGKYFR